ncbi:MAG: ClpXP protease specificity-enhancing factor SspB [Nitrosomonas sp.]|nr:ClpXP protease specificity-enhancing factor SspB [Nitrosomonas sp.]
MKNISVKPYLIRAVYQWCVDNNVTPQLTVVSIHCHNLPENLMTHEDVTLNIGPSATTNLLIDNEFIQFDTRFNGFIKKITIPVDAIKAVFSKELEHGLTFVNGIMEHTKVNLVETEDSKNSVPDKPNGLKTNANTNRSKPFLKIIK